MGYLFNTELAKKEGLTEMLVPMQCRAARALLEWTQGDLAEKASISAVSIRAFEKGGEMRDNNRKLIKLTFEAAGVTFLDTGETTNGGPGVRITAPGIVREPVGLGEAKDSP